MKSCIDYPRKQLKTTLIYLIFCTYFSIFCQFKLRATSKEVSKTVWKRNYVELFDTELENIDYTFHRLNLKSD